jgi:hypothetical protein
MLRPLAEKLQALLAQQLGVTLPITEERGGPGIVLTADSFGDIYSGSTYYATLSVDHPPLRLQFRFSEHQLSGQCDEWSLEVKGAREEERAAFGEVFHPRQRGGHWNNHVDPTYTFNGAPASFD